MNLISIFCSGWFLGSLSLILGVGFEEGQILWKIDKGIEELQNSTLKKLKKSFIGRFLIILLAIITLPTYAILFCIFGYIYIPCVLIYYVYKLCNWLIRGEK